MPEDDILQEIIYFKFLFAFILFMPLESLPLSVKQ
jgi:hypothetical protein